MNILAFGLLSLLTKGSSTGYDLMRHLQLFWSAAHSQIYPLLAKLEKERYVQFEHVQQNDKPDKKIYTITDAGTAVLREWLSEPCADPVTRDETLLKVYCLHVGDRAAARAIFAQRIELYEDRLLKYNAKLDKLREQYGADMSGISFGSEDFGSYMIIVKAVMTAETYLKWCKWALTLVPEDQQ